MNKITLKVLLGITILISAFFLVGCDNKSRYSTSSFPKAQRQLVKAIKKADLDTVKDLAYKIDLETTNKDGVTILKAAILEGFDHKEDASFPTRVEIISELVKAGANPNNFSGPGYSPYGLATSSASTGNTWILKALLDGGMSANVMRDGKMPIINDVIIKTSDNLDAIKLLIEYDADVNIRSKKGYAPIFDAITMDNIYLALYLVENGANINVTNTMGGSLAWATFNAETRINSGNAFRTSNYPNFTDEERKEYIAKQKEALIKLKEILIERGYTWPPEEPELYRKNREESERIKEEKRLYKEKYNQ